MEAGRIKEPGDSFMKDAEDNDESGPHEAESEE